MHDGGKGLCRRQAQSLAAAGMQRTEDRIYGVSALGAWCGALRTPVKVQRPAQSGRKALRHRSYREDIHRLLIKACFRV